MVNKIYGGVSLKGPFLLLHKGVLTAEHITTSLSVDAETGLKVIDRL